MVSTATAGTEATRGGGRHRFNDDLLDNAGDVERARIAYPAVAAALDHPELRDLFRTYDGPANEAKRRSLLAGRLAVGLGTFALVVAAANQISHAPAGHPDLTWTVLNWVAAAAGIASFVIGMAGVMRAGSKRRWLQNRLMTERLRQHHFQALACRPGEILGLLASPEGTQVFLERRRTWLEQFRQRHEGKLGAELDMILGSDEARDAWLHPPPRPEAAGGLDGEAGAQLLAAYRELRMTHQLQHVTHKLGSSEGLALLSNLPRDQARTYSGISLSMIAALLAIHMGVLLTSLAGWLEPAHSPVLHFLTLAAAVVALAVRTLEEGLKPEREIERYTRYRSAIRAIRDRFDAGRTPEDKLEAMQDMERLASEEMGDFLRTHHHARFVM